MPPLTEKELEERVTAAGKHLVQLPSSLDELLPLLDKIEGLLSKVEQSPTKSMHAALSLLMKALVVEDLLKHSDVDVKVGVASCISEITRITAPDAPYDDDKMKDVFQLIVSSFEHFSDMSNRSYEKRATILETVAKVRSCVIMLDLECDQMIIEMFQHFLNAIRAYHPEHVYTSMETIMTLVLEESEEISADLLAPILSILKRNNEAVTPIAKRLAERVIENSVEKLRPYIREVVKSLDTSLDDYSEVVASVCRENTDTVRLSNESSLSDQLAGEDGSEEANIQDKDPNILRRTVVSNGINETGPEEIMTDANSLKTAGSNNQLDAKLTFKAEYNDSSVQKPVISEVIEELAKSQQVPCNHDIPEKYIPNSPTEIKSAEAAESLDTVDSIIDHSLSDTREREAITVPSPSQSGSHLDESRYKTENLENGHLVSEEMVSVDTASKKSSAGESLSESKMQQYLGKKRTTDSAVKDKALTEKIASSNDDGYESDSETQSMEQAEKEKRNVISEEMVSVDTASKKTSEGESISEAKKQRRSGKVPSADSANKDKTVTEEVAPKNDDGCASDSEARSLDHTKKGKGDMVGEEVLPVAASKASEGESISKEKKQQFSGKMLTADSAYEPRSLDQAEKGKGDMVSEEMVSIDTASKKASEGESISEAKKLWSSGKRGTADSSEMDRTLTEEDALKKNDGYPSDSEAQFTGKGKRNLISEEIISVDTISGNASEGESISEAKKQQRSGKKLTTDSFEKDKTLTEEVASKNDDGCASDSIERSPVQAKNGKGNFLSEDIISVDTGSKRASKGEPISEAKKQRHSGKKRPADKDKKLTEEVAQKKDDGRASDSEQQTLDKAEKGKMNLVSEEMVSFDTASKRVFEGESLSEAKKRQGSGKKRTADSADKGKTLTVEIALKNDDGCASDSETRLPDREKKGKGNMVSEDMVSADTASKKASEGESVSGAKCRRSGKKRTVESANKGKTMTVEVALKNDDGCVSDLEARLLDQAEKIEDARTKTDHGSSFRKEDSKKSRCGKHTPEQDLPKVARENHDKETIRSWKSPLKSTKKDSIEEYSPRTSSKRKRMLDKEKASETPEYGKNLIGSKVRIWWPKDRMFYEGQIASFDPVKKKHKILYNDGDEEVLILKRERWELIGDDLFSDGDQDVEHLSHDTSSDMKRKKKGNTHPETSSKCPRVEGSPKRKSKDHGKAESDLKPSKRSVEDPIKSKDQTQKSGSKGQVDSPKASSKSKDDVAKVSSHSRQDNGRTSKSKDKTPQSGKTLKSGKTPRSGKTPSSLGTKMTKSSSSKAKETGLTKEKTAETAKSSEMAKGKSKDTAKSRESEAMGGKKLRR